MGNNMVLNRRLDWTTACMAYLLPGYVLGLETHNLSNFFTGPFIIKSHYNSLVPVELGLCVNIGEESRIEYHHLDVKKAMHIIKDDKRLKEKIIAMISPYLTVQQNVLYDDKDLLKILEEKGISDMEDFFRGQLKGYQRSPEVETESRYRELKEKLKQINKKVKK